MPEHPRGSTGATRTTADAPRASWSQRASIAVQEVGVDITRLRREAAREQCRRLSLKRTAHRGIGGLKEATAFERRQSAAEEGAATRATHSLSSLLDDDVERQATQGRISARKAKKIFDLYVVTSWPVLAQIPAAEVIQNQVIDMRRRLIE